MTLTLFVLFIIIYIAYLLNRILYWKYNYFEETQDQIDLSKEELEERVCLYSSLYREEHEKHSILKKKCLELENLCRENKKTEQIKARWI